MMISRKKRWTSTILTRSVILQVKTFEQVVLTPLYKP